MGQGNGDLLISMWRSLLNHVCDKHDGHDGSYTKCLHDHLEDRQWMNSTSRAFHELKIIVDNPLLLRDIRWLSPERTARKQGHGSLFLHFNENVGRQQALTQEGEERWKIKSSKARRGHFTVAPVKEELSYVIYFSVDPGQNSENRGIAQCIAEDIQRWGSNREILIMVDFSGRVQSIDGFEDHHNGLMLQLAETFSPEVANLRPDCVGDTT
ncbi:hypothetical protein MRX96_058238 [Rhipicephalus microplus]